MIFRSRYHDDYNPAYLNGHVRLRALKRSSSFLHLTAGRVDVCLYCLCLSGDHSLRSSDFFATLQPKMHCGGARILWNSRYTDPLPHIQWDLLVAHPRQHMVAPEPRVIPTKKCMRCRWRKPLSKGWIFVLLPVAAVPRSWSPSSVLMSCQPNDLNPEPL